MDEFDYILFPFFAGLLWLYVSLQRKKLKDPVLRKYFITGFWIKVAGAVFFSLFQVYLAPGGDSYTYYSVGKNIFDLVLKDAGNIKLIYESGANFDASLLYNPNNIGYINQESFFWVARVATVACFLSFGKYLIANLLFSMLCYAGVWKLFRFFYTKYSVIHKKLAIAILYLPSFVFWSSGVSKEAICISGMGFITWGLYEMFSLRKNLIANTVMVSLFSYLMLQIKSYILVSYLSFLLLYFLISYLSKVKEKAVKWVITGLLIITMGAAFVVSEFSANGIIQSAAKALVENVQYTKTMFESQSDIGESNFELGATFDGTVGSLFKIAPFGTVATFYRPFFWEARKPSTLFAAIESFCFLVFTLYVLVRSNLFFFRDIFTNKLVFFCFFYSMVFAVFVGASTPNFGSLVRYKIPCLPFFLLALFIIQYNASVRSSALESQPLKA